jgi:protein-disulfide isomerase
MNVAKSNRIWEWALLAVIFLSIIGVQVLTQQTAVSAKIKASGSQTGGGEAGVLLVKGSDHASVTIVEYTDFLCAPCRAASQILEQVEKAYPDEIQVIFKHYPSALKAESLLVHEASMAAAAQGKFWPMHDRLINHRRDATEDDLLRFATELGLDLGAFSGVLEDHRFRDRILHEMTEARGFGVTRAPTFFINGWKLVGPRPLAMFRQIIDRELGITQTAREAPSGSPGDSPEGRVEVPLGNAPVRGSAGAPITLVEYSDFQCPFCARATPTIRRLTEEYDGRVRWVFKHFPLPIHPDAPLAHEVSLAAGEQGKFWEMHDLIFENQRKMKREHLLGYAKDLGLDVARIEKDVDSGKFKPLVDADLKEGQGLGVRATPTFFINGRRVIGAVPYETIKQVVDQELSEISP